MVVLLSTIRPGESGERRGREESRDRAQRGTRRVVRNGIGGNAGQQLRVIQLLGPSVLECAAEDRVGGERQEQNRTGDVGKGTNNGNGPCGVWVCMY